MEYHKVLPKHKEIVKLEVTQALTFPIITSWQINQNNYSFSSVGGYLHICIQSLKTLQ